MAAPSALNTNYKPKDINAKPKTNKNVSHGIRPKCGETTRRALPWIVQGHQGSRPGTGMADPYKLATAYKTPPGIEPKRGGIANRAPPWTTQIYQGNCSDSGAAVSSKPATAYKPKEIKTELKPNKKAQPGIEPKWGGTHRTLPSTAQGHQGNRSDSGVAASSKPATAYKTQGNKNRAKTQQKSTTRHRT